MSSGSTARPVANYPGTSEYLRLASDADFIQLFSLLSYINTYITTTNRNDLKSEALRAPFTAAMEEANRMKEVIEADQLLKAADAAFRVEMVTLLGQVQIRETKENLRFAAAGALLTVGAAVVVGPVLAVGALNMIGFSSVGPVAGKNLILRKESELLNGSLIVVTLGSVAAGVQSAVYGGAVTSGSIFALCQSAAMGGIVMGSAAEIAAGVAALGAGAGLLGGLGGSDNNDDAGPDEAGSDNGHDDAWTLI
ncbi:hypothetical protein FRC04_012113 [Tulasnella sp. 424]|nr:hypothetical protein FRC04_012113 [Tulasnella sp. 424]KAG8971076.1 hypothetical protein FRC05_011542 [Tulasnella sp. 425]